MNRVIQNKQKGAAILAVTVIILLIVSLMVFFATRVGAIDQRMAGNERRHKESFATAEAGLEMAIQRFIKQFQTNYNGSASSWTTIINNSAIPNGTETDGTTAESGEPSFGVTITNTGANFNGMTVFEFLSTGKSADLTGTARVRRQVTMASILGGGAPDVPVIVSGSVGTGGDFNITANPNGGGPGVPVSIWTGKYVNCALYPSGDCPTAVDMTGSSATCHMQFFSGNNAQCSNPSGNSELISDGDGTVLTSYNNTFPDILPNDPNFPDDLFRFLFGVNRADWATVKAMADSYGHVVSDCSSLNSTSGQVMRLWWVTGDCDMSSGQVIGSNNDPVILIIDDHRLKMIGGGGTIYGIAFIFNNPDNPYNNVSGCQPQNPPPCVDFNGSSVIYGALVSDVGGQAMNGSYSVVYKKMLFDNLTTGNDSANFMIAYIPGSWRDF